MLLTYLGPDGLTYSGKVRFGLMGQVLKLVLEIMSIECIMDNLHICEGSSLMLRAIYRFWSNICFLHTTSPTCTSFNDMTWQKNSVSVRLPLQQLKIYIEEWENHTLNTLATSVVNSQVAYYVLLDETVVGMLQFQHFAATFLRSCRHKLQNFYISQNAIM